MTTQRERADENQTQLLHMINYIFQSDYEEEGWKQIISKIMYFNGIQKTHRPVTLQARASSFGKVGHNPLQIEHSLDYRVRNNLEAVPELHAQK